MASTVYETDNCGAERRLGWTKIQQMQETFLLFVRTEVEY